MLNQGIISPGLPTGLLTIDGDFVQDSSGFLDIELGGAASGELNVIGQATLAVRSTSRSRPRSCR